MAVAWLFFISLSLIFFLSTRSNKFFVVNELESRYKKLFRMIASKKVED